MTRLHRLANILTWALIVWAVLWICLWGIPGIVDLCSKHEAQQAGETREMVSEKVSKGD